MHQSEDIVIPSSRSRSGFIVTLSFPKRPETPSEINEAIGMLMKSIIDKPSTDELPQKFDLNQFADLSKPCNHVFYSDVVSGTPKSVEMIVSTLLKAIKTKQENYLGFQFSRNAHEKSNPYFDLIPYHFNILNGADMTHCCESAIKHTNGKGFMAFFDKVQYDLLLPFFKMNSTNVFVMDGFAEKFYDAVRSEQKDWCVYVPATYSFILYFIPDHSTLQKMALDNKYTYIVLTNKGTYFF